jgi:L-2,4-diaminobutyrate decarboxylase
VDLDRPLPDTAAALEERETVYLRDAIYFHDATYVAHLNCPVVIPALVGEAGSPGSPPLVDVRRAHPGLS